MLSNPEFLAEGTAVKVKFTFYGSSFYGLGHSPKIYPFFYSFPNCSMYNHDIDDDYDDQCHICNDCQKCRGLGTSGPVMIMPMIDNL